MAIANVCSDLFPFFTSVCMLLVLFGRVSTMLGFFRNSAVCVFGGFGG